MKIAVVGSGVSGLVVAKLLSSKHEVTVYEADHRIGGHISTVAVQSRGLTFNIDTGFIVFNPVNYPLFTALLDELEVVTQPTKMSFGVKDDRTGIEYCGNSVNSLFSQRKNLLRPQHWHLLADIRRFMAHGALQARADPSMTLLEFVRRGGYSKGFDQQFLVPLASALWSCPQDSIHQFPVRFVLEFLENHSMLQLSDRPEWRVIKGGSKMYLEKLLASLKVDIRTGSPVLLIERMQSGVRLTVGTECIEYDEVVMACHSDQALQMVKYPTEAEREILSAFPYQSNNVVLHTDSSLLPKSKRAWAAWNYRIPTTPSAQATVTYNMNILQGLVAEETFCVSLNEADQIDPAKIIKSFRYEHPVATIEGESARLRRSEMIRHKGISYCGAYWGYGFHEDGVRSAVEVAEGFDIRR